MADQHAKWLREAAEQIADAGHNGWGNTCTQAADHIVELRARIALLEADVQVQMSIVRDHSKEVKRLTAENTALWEDRERLDWLESNPDRVLDVSWQVDSENDLRSAIDAGRGKK